MGFIDKLKKWTNLDEYEEEMAPESAETSAPAPAEEKPADYSFESFSKSRARVTTINTTTKLQVVLVKPDSFEDAAGIADDLKQSHTVVLNLESTNKDVARRLLDFLSGVAYANEGKIKKVAISTYIITPFNVDILGDLIDELENNGLYF